MPPMTRRNFVACGCLGLAGTAISGCTVNPATGRSAFTGLMSTDQEIRTGKDTHPKILEEFGGDYGSRQLRGYVDSIGQRLADGARASGDVTGPLTFTFTVLNSPIVNAFAVPGGYIYISRGLLALAGSEAELAGVLGHEIGHITGRHTAERYSQSVLAQFGLAGVGMLAEAVGVAPAGTVMQLGGPIAQSVLASWSRDQELEADTLGVRYIARTGYQPRAMATFLAKLRNDAILQAKLAGRPPGTVDQTHALSTHPRTIDRVELALPEARKYPVRNPRTGRDDYLHRIDGILYGDDPAQGILKDRTFQHPTLRFAFTVPDGFQVQNGSQMVTAANSSGASFRFFGGRKPAGQAIRQTLLAQAAIAKVRLRSVETLTIGGMPAATGAVPVRGQRGPMDMRLVTIQWAPDRAYVFQFLSPRRLTGQLDGPFRQTAFSFRRLTASQAAAIRPLTLRTLTVRRGDTVQGLAARLPFDDFKVDRFATLNDLKPGAPLRSGTLLKTVAG